MTTLMRRLLLLLRGRPEDAIRPFKALQQTCSRAEVIVRCYYGCSLMVALQLIALDRTLVLDNLRPLWPVLWAKLLAPASSLRIVIAFHTLGVMAAAFFPERRWARLAAFLGLFEHMAFSDSYNRLGPTLDAWMLVSFLLVFLPDRGPGEERARRECYSFVLVFRACQALVLMTYSMAGVTKLFAAAYQYRLGMASAFSLNGLAYHVASRFYEMNQRQLSWPGEAVLSHPVLGWLMFVGVIYLQIFSFPVAFRPRIRTAWAGGLILFHVMAYFMLEVHFFENPALLGLFFLADRRERKASLRDMALDLPLCGFLARSGARR